jgi:hypothetical protein
MDLRPIERQQHFVIATTARTPTTTAAKDE